MFVIYPVVRETKITPLDKVIYLFCLCLVVASTRGDDFSLDSTFRWNLANQDPALADPRGAITCVGELPNFEYKEPPPGTPRSEQSLQKLCAQAQYGGYPRPYNTEMMCVPWYSASIDRELYPERFAEAWFENREIEDWLMVRRAGDVEDASIPDHISQLLSSTTPEADRQAAYCALRCTCTGVPEDLRRPTGYFSIVPDSIIDISRSRLEASDYPLRIFGSHGLDYRAKAMLMNSVILQNKPGVMDENFHPVRQEEDMLAIAERNLVRCFGPLPRTPLPSPATPDMYASAHPDWELRDSMYRATVNNPMTRICAVALSYGDNRLNAGAYCHPSPTDESLAEVWFSDEMTPNINWTFSPPDSANTDLETRLRVIRLRQHCSEQCLCAKRGITTQHIPRVIFTWLRSLVGARRKPGPGMMESPTSAADAARSGSMYSSRNNAEQEPPRTNLQSLNSAGGNTGSFSRLRLPSSQSFSVPISPAPRCAIPCTSAKDCLVRPANSGRECANEKQCVAIIDQSHRDSLSGQRPAMQKGEGSSPGQEHWVISLARCASVMSAMMALGGRDVSSRKDSAFCVCNSTYVSAGCCRSDDGIIWEEPEHRIGSLVAL